MSDLPDLEVVELDKDDSDSPAQPCDSASVQSDHESEGQDLSDACDETSFESQVAVGAVRGRGKNPYDLQGKPGVFKGPNAGLFKLIERRSRQKNRKPDHQVKPTSLDPTSFDELLKCDAESYGEWEKLYKCYVPAAVGDCCAPNPPETSKSPSALIPLLSLIPFSELKRCNVPVDLPPCMMEGTDCAKGVKPRMALSVVVKYLSLVHAFSALGLEAQATAYSHDNGIIRYLALPPQENLPNSVWEKTSLDRISLDPILTAIEYFNKQEPGKTGVFTPRCWILSRPRHKPLLSADGLYQLYKKTLKQKNMFALVLSPRGTGIKALCVHLTRSGKKEIDRFCHAAPKHRKQYVLQCIAKSETPLYCQVPFEIVDDVPCCVVDFRDKDDVIRQLKTSIENGTADTQWI